MTNGMFKLEHFGQTVTPGLESRNENRKCFLTAMKGSGNAFELDELGLDCGIKNVRKNKESATEGLVSVGGLKVNLSVKKAMARRIKVLVNRGI